MPTMKVCVVPFTSGGRSFTTTANAFVPQGTMGQGFMGQAIMGRRYRDLSRPSRQQAHGKIELTYDKISSHLATSMTLAKKLRVLAALFLIQLTASLNASMYGNAVGPLYEQNYITSERAQAFAMLWIVLNAFSSDFWGPISDLYGRWLPLQAAMLMLNIFAVVSAATREWHIIILLRCTSALCLPAISLTTAVVGDMWEGEDRHLAMILLTFAANIGGLLGPCVGIFMELSELEWYWAYILQALVGTAAQFIHIFIPETSRDRLTTQEAAKRRKRGHSRVYSTAELKGLTYADMFVQQYSLFPRFPLAFITLIVCTLFEAISYAFFESWNIIWQYRKVASNRILLILTPQLAVYILAFGLYIGTLAHVRWRKVKGKITVLEPQFYLKWVAPTTLLTPLAIATFSITAIGSQDCFTGTAITVTTIVAFENFLLGMAALVFLMGHFVRLPLHALGGTTAKLPVLLVYICLKIPLSTLR